MKFCLWMKEDPNNPCISDFIRDWAEDCKAYGINNSEGIAPTFRSYKQLVKFVEELYPYYDEMVVLHIEDKHISKRQLDYIQKKAAFWTKKPVQALITKVDRIPDVVAVTLSTSGNLQCFVAELKYLDNC